MTTALNHFKLLCIPAFLFALSACSSDPAAPDAGQVEDIQEEEDITVDLPEPAADYVAPLPMEGAEIFGHGTIELRIGRTQNLRHLQLVLIPADMADTLRDIRNDRWLERSSRFNFNDGYNNLDLQSIGFAAVQAAVARTKADSEGLYRFTGIQPGSYLIYAQYRSRYAVAYWLVPVTVESIDERIEIDINNDNFKEVHNLRVR